VLLDVLLVAGGGAIGSAARYLVTLWAARAIGPGFPYGTLIVNVVGSALLGVILALSLGPAMPPRLRLALGTGVMGGFTTYSTFNYETIALLIAGEYAPACANVLITLIACFAGGWLGLLLGRAAAGA
jgi:CrcB protein